jgi:hypothetical protein
MRRKSRLRLWLLDHLPKRSCGLGKPISEAPHFIVRVFYGGYWIEESLEGPFTTEREAMSVWDEMHAKGYGAIIYSCVNTRNVSASD